MCQRRWINEYSTISRSGIKKKQEMSRNSNDSVHVKDILKTTLLSQAALSLFSSDFIFIYILYLIYR